MHYVFGIQIIFFHLPLKRSSLPHHSTTQFRSRLETTQLAIAKIALNIEIEEYFFALRHKNKSIAPFRYPVDVV
jgi:hypothetical protein